MNASFQIGPDAVVLDSFYWSDDTAFDDKPDAIYLDANQMRKLKELVAESKAFRKSCPWITSVATRRAVAEPLAVTPSETPGLLDTSDALQNWRFMGVEVFMRDYKGEKDAIHVWFERRHIDDADILIQAEVRDLAEDSGRHTGVEACRATQ